MEQANTNSTIETSGFVDSVIPGDNQSIIISDTNIDQTGISGGNDETVIDGGDDEIFIGDSAGEKVVRGSAVEKVVRGSAGGKVVRGSAGGKVLRGRIDRTIVRGPVDRTIVRGPVDRTIVRGPVDRTIARGPVDRTIVRGPVDQPVILEKGVRGVVVTVNRLKHFAFLKRKDKVESNDIFVRECSITNDIQQKKLFLSDTCVFDIMRTPRGVEAVNVKIQERHIKSVSQLPKIPRKQKETNEQETHVPGELFKSTIAELFRQALNRK